MSFLYDIDYTFKHKIIKILGFLKIKLKHKQSPNEVNLHDLRCYTMAANFHKSLEKYRGIFTDKDVLIVGGGSSLEYLDTLPENTVNIGINRAFLLNHLNFDYLFAQDDFPDKNTLEDFIKYKEDTCIKFLGRHTNTLKSWIMKNSTISQIKKKEIYILNNRRPNESILPIDISAEPFARYLGTVFAVLQFCFFANAKRIYLAGFDCNVGHMFRNEDNKPNLTSQYEYWIQFKEYIDTIYENCELISINPVRLKGMFKDVYTKSYLEAHPEIDRTDIEILN